MRPMIDELAAGERRNVAMTVNHTHRDAEVEARRTLCDYLRHDLGLTGTHVGCEHGVCGACTVLLDGVPVRSCLVFAVSAAGHRVTTVEGLGQLDESGDPASLSPVQRAFRDCHALQCGFCTPGFLTTITAGLATNPHPTREQAVEMIAGNLCRCTGYQNIVDAVLRAAELMSDPDAAQPDRFAEHADAAPADDPPAGRRDSLPGESEPSSADGTPA